VLLNSPEESVAFDDIFMVFFVDAALLLLYIDLKLLQSRVITKLQSVGVGTNTPNSETFELTRSR
jgi:hypothetical protein